MACWIRTAWCSTDMEILLLAMALAVLAAVLSGY